MAKKRTRQKKPVRRAASSLVGRLRRLEESHLFAQRDLEVLGDQVASLQRHLQSLAERIVLLDASTQHAARGSSAPAPPVDPGDAI